jgi:hypothetical protein
VFKHITGIPELPPLKQTEANGKRHYTLPDGRMAPSVTTVLGHFTKEHLEQWKERVGEEQAARITRQAGVRGSKLHKMIENYLENKPAITESTDLLEKQSFLDMRPALDRINNIHYIEAQLYSTRLFLAGRTDCIAEYDGTLSIIDFKTSLRVKREDWITDYFLQSTAYAWMCEECTGIPVKQIVILISVDHEPEPQVFIKKRNDYTRALYDKIRQYHIDMKTAG